MIFMSQPNGTNSCLGLNGNTKPDNDEQMLSRNCEEEEEQDSSEKNSRGRARQLSQFRQQSNSRSMVKLGK